MGNNIDQILIRYEFDSKIFNTDVYKIESENELNSKSLNAALNDAKKGMIFLFMPFHAKSIHLVLNKKFILVGIRNTYKLSGTKKTFLSNKRSVDVRPISEMEKHLIDDVYNEMVEVAMSGRRFANDPVINQVLVKKFYRVWLENSFFHNYADQVFFVVNENRICGFVTLKVKGKKGYIDLLGILPKYQRRGFGKMLVNKAIAYMHERSISSITVVTEGENTATNSLYQKNGFIIEDVKFVFHKHLG